MRTDELKRKILQMFNDSEYHGYEISKQLAEESFDIELSRLYRVLNEMAEENLLVGRWEKSPNGPRKKMYKIGKKGIQEREKALLEAIETIHSHYDQYIMNLSEELSVFDYAVNRALEDTKPGCTICVITPNVSSIQLRMLSTIIKHRHNSTIYLICPKKSNDAAKLANISQMEGSFNNIPVKEGYIDVSIILGVPLESILEKSIAEWKRVIAKDGTIYIITPTVLVEEYKHPMTIGQYIENYEHATTRKFEFPKKEKIRNLLKSNFKDVEEEKMIHLSMYKAKN